MSMMDRTMVERHRIIEAVITLPNEALVELAVFLDYLHYKSAHQSEPDHQASNFLLAVAGLGNSNQQGYLRAR